MTSPMRTADFVDSFGVNTRMAYNDGKYVSYNNVIADMNYLGLRNVRDSVPFVQHQITAYNAMANNGIKFDFVALGGIDPATVVSSIASFAAQRPGSVIAIEGLNEIDNFPVKYKGLTGVAAATAYMNDLTTGLENNATLSAIDRYDLTGALINTNTDFTNFHPYPANGNQPYKTIAQQLQPLQAWSSKPTVITETGYYTAPNSSYWGGVDQITQAKLTLNLMMDVTLLGIQKTYLYQLLDAYADPSGIKVDENIGLFDLNNNPKLAATAIHNLTSILSDTASNAESFQSQSVNYTLTAQNFTVSSLQFQKASGATQIALWSEPDIWDEVADVPIQVAASNVTVNFGSNRVNVTVYDPLNSASAFATYSNVTSVNIAVSDHPIIVEITGVGGAGSRPGSDPTLTIDPNTQVFGDNTANTLIGTVGADTMRGGKGDDIYTVNHAGDIVVENANEGNDTIQSSVSYRAPANIENLVLTGTAAIDAWANDQGMTLTGNSGANRLYGGAGNDTLNGGAGADTMAGGAGNDTYYVDNVNDVVVEHANEGTDRIFSTVSYRAPANIESLTLTGTAAIDAWANDQGMTLTGNSGANRLYSGAGIDTMAGGAGNDTYYVNDAGDIVVENAGEGTDQIFSTVSYHAPVNVETLTLTGTDNLDAWANNQGMTLVGNAGNNRLYGGTGNDTLNGGEGADTMAGGLGNDTYYVDNINDVVVENANEGTDKIFSTISYRAPANIENLTLTGTADIDAWANDQGMTLVGNSGVNRLYGGLGADTLNGGAGADIMAGGAGGDTYIVDNVDDVVIENPNEGYDQIWSTVSYRAPDNVELLTLSGSANLDAWANDQGMGLMGNTGNNRLYGGAGADALNGGSGADYMAGGAGNDTYYVDNIDDVVFENPNEGTDTIQSSVSYYAPDNVEILTLSGTANLDAWANDQGMTLNGNSGNNRLYGGAGNDKLNGGAGADIMAGGAGDDIYTVDNVGDVVVENANEGTDTIQSSVSYRAPVNIEILTLTGAAAIDAWANDQGMTLNGNSAANKLYGGDGDDTLNGGAGADTMAGGDGDDYYYVDNVNDVVVEHANEGIDTILSTVSYHAPANVEILTLSGSAAKDAWANDQGMTLNGNSLANKLYGGAGNDILNGGTGADTMTGGNGNDFYYVDNSGDVVVELANGGIDTVSSSISYTLGANVENLILTSSSNLSGTGNELDNVITGNAYNNVLKGMAGNDIIDGGAGNDTIDGGAGNDLLHGGAGKDTFIFGLGGGQDIIDDFTIGDDKLDVSAYVKAGYSATLTSSAAGVTIGFSSGDSVLLLGIHVQDLHVTSAGVYY